MTYDEMKTLISSRHDSSIYELANDLGVNIAPIINQHLNDHNSSTLMPNDAADAAYWEIVKICETTYFRDLSRNEVDVLFQALGSTGTLRLAENMEYNSSTIVSVWKRINIL